MRLLIEHKNGDEGTRWRWDATWGATVRRGGLCGARRPFRHNAILADTMPQQVMHDRTDTPSSGPQGRGLIDPRTPRVETSGHGADGLRVLHGSSESPSLALASVHRRVPMHASFDGIGRE
jgi:hypothetical protein